MLWKSPQCYLRGSRQRQGSDRVCNSPQVDTFLCDFRGALVRFHFDSLVPKNRPPPLYHSLTRQTQDPLPEMTRSRVGATFSLRIS